jgi:hypothetical protein
MNKLDQHGFMTHSWASSNIDGFDDLDPCCQQLHILFPDVPHDCNATGLATKPVPVFVVDPALSTYSKIHPGALLIPAGLLVPTGSRDSVKVDLSGSWVFLLTAVLAVMISRLFRHPSSVASAGFFNVESGAG